MPLHDVVPAPQRHPPLTQLAQVPHVTPHAPQSYGSVFTSTQALLQLVNPLAQLSVHAPCEQTCVVVQLTPQPPQFDGSLCVCVQTPPQNEPLL
jgi:hypothetical protein